MAFLVLDCFSKPSSLIPTFTWILDESYDKDCNGSLLAYGCTSQEVKYASLDKRLETNSKN